MMIKQSLDQIWVDDKATETPVRDASGTTSPFVGFKELCGIDTLAMTISDLLDEFDRGEED